MVSHQLYNGTLLNKTRLVQDLPQVVGSYYFTYSENLYLLNGILKQLTFNGINNVIWFKATTSYLLNTRPIYSLTPFPFLISFWLIEHFP